MLTNGVTLECLRRGKQLKHAGAIGQFDKNHRRRAAPAGFLTTDWRDGAVSDTAACEAKPRARRAKPQPLAARTDFAGAAGLTASIAHEINQPLSAIIMNAVACQRWLSAEAPNLGEARLAVARLVRNADATIDLVKKLNALFRQTELHLAPTDMNAVITEACNAMVAASKPDVEIAIELDAQIPPVMADPRLIGQVLFNVMRNGLEATDTMPGAPKRLTIRSRRVEAGSIRVDVVDAGKGVADAERIFEPFFTTKQNSMGMGLAISRKIIEAHHGRMWAASNRTKGTTITFTLAAPG